MAQPISPAQEQEFTDAKAAVEAAQRAQAEKYAPEPLKQAQDLLVTAENARSFKDRRQIRPGLPAGPGLCRTGESHGRTQTEEEKLAADPGRAAESQGGNRPPEKIPVERRKDP